MLDFPEYGSEYHYFRPCLRMEQMGKTVTCLPFCGKFDNFKKYKFIFHQVYFSTPSNVVTVLPLQTNFFALSCIKIGQLHTMSNTAWCSEVGSLTSLDASHRPSDLASDVREAISNSLHQAGYCVHHDICVSPGWLHKVQWVLCTVFWPIDMTGVFAGMSEAVCNVTTVLSHLNRLYMGCWKRTHPPKQKGGWKRTCDPQCKFFFGRVHTFSTPLIIQSLSTNL